MYSRFRKSCNRMCVHQRPVKGLSIILLRSGIPPRLGLGLLGAKALMARFCAKLTTRLACVLQEPYHLVVQKFDFDDAPPGRPIMPAYLASRLAGLPCKSHPICSPMQGRCAPLPPNRGRPCDVERFSARG